ncbi:hypothetical protein LOK49_LG06G03305 [Camellia lanceoleosa]|uniref:Uncharacterized protein n=1 Tax=Camellia lanceoleosa TaxID=1840588 RepID=A0ACC0HB26_9ERIC|nr:hypothetical protein LOK49_LG06G03305 [Camellia lanceoleosa]
MLCRQRQYDDKWEHHLYKDDEPQVSTRKLSGNGSVSGARDLREKLSGTMYSQPVNTDPPKPVLKDNKPVRKSVIVEALEPQTKNVASSVARKKTQQKTRTLPVLFLPLHFITTVMYFESVDTFLQSLGLEKYSITFQVEERLCTTGDNLKALGIPMVNLTKLTLVYTEILSCYNIWSKKEDTLGIGIQSLTFGVDQVLLHVSWILMLWSDNILTSQQPCFNWYTSACNFLGLILQLYW